MLNWLKRKGLRLYIRIVREKKPPEFIARGWAVGMFIGCAVPFGFQLVISVPLAIWLKGSRVGAVLGTLITNPFTIFIIYPFQSWVADQLLLGGNLSYSRLAQTEWDFETVMALGAETFEAFILGGVMLALVMTPLTYLTVLKIVRRYRAHALKRGGRR